MISVRSARFLASHLRVPNFREHRRVSFAVHALTPRVGWHLAVDLLDDTVPGCGNGRLGSAGELRRAVNREGIRRVRDPASKLAAHGRDRRLGLGGRCASIVRSVLPSSTLNRTRLGLIWIKLRLDWRQHVCPHDAEYLPVGSLTRLVGSSSQRELVRRIEALNHRAVQ